MRVLDLHCSNGHTFEGWFASEQDFLDQGHKSLVQCPVCADSTITKKLSAPRLNLSGQLASDPQTTEAPPTDMVHMVAQAWAALSKKVLDNSEDVGQQFAEEARRIHYGESRLRAIRGQTTLDEVHSLVDEGIEVMPLLVPESHKNSLH
jgi:hypothetical protein